MYFPTAGIECHPFIPFAAALGISFVTSMGGISGAFLLLPFQMSVLGYVNPSVSSTNQFFNVLACPSGVWRYWREGRMLWPLAFTVALGTLPGVFLGAFIRITLLPDPASFQLFAGLLLLYMGLRMARLLWRERGRRPAPRPAGQNLSSCRVLAWNSRVLEFTFQDAHYSVSTRKLALLSLAVGLVGGAYGIGGGAILAPFLVACFGLPVHVVAGATLLATWLTSLAGVGFYTLLAPFYPHLTVAPDWRMGLLVGLGGLCGVYLGARCQKHVPAFALKALLAAVLLFTALRYLGQGV